MKKSVLLTLCAASLLFTACEKNNNSGITGDAVSTSKYVTAATSSEATYLLTSDALTEGRLSINGDGLEVDNATTFLFHGSKYVYRLVYNQGNAGITTSYRLDEYGDIEERNIKHEIQNRFTTYGIYNQYIITAASGATSTTDEAGNNAYGITYTLIDTENQALSTQTVSSENLLGTGEYCTISGIVQANGKIYGGICPEGVSVYGVNAYNELLSEDAKALINTEGGISGTITPNQVWVAIYTGTEFDSPKIITDNRISYATSRYRSQYYSNIEADDAGNVYVFSASHATIQAGIQKTDLPSGVIRINAGTDAFDQDYYVNFEDESVAGRAMYKVWHITGDYFLMQMYHEKTDDKSYTANTNRLGIFKADSKTFTWVSGIPGAEEISSLSKNAYAENGIAYIAITPVTEGATPTIYAIDPTTAQATEGLKITAQGVSAIGKLRNY